ncbi:MAG TPA: ParA family protein [Bryobacteraceae bacterium]|jgi:chromosome partitioning protein|nr:ParA family protein [Bryobacteraceae bacterium]
MIRLVIANQRGGVAKTTTALVLARIYADQGKRVLLVDTDSQGSIGTVISLKAKYHLSDFLVGHIALEECLVSAGPNIDVLPSNRNTSRAEDLITAQGFREFVFEQMFSSYEHNYDAILIDVAPSITLFQTCAMVYTRRVLIPVAMEILSVQGAMASLEAARTLNTMFANSYHLPVETVGMLPVMVDRRLAMTGIILDTLEQIAEKTGVPRLTAVRTDTSVVKANKERQFLADFDPKSKALEDYQVVADEVLAIMRQLDGIPEAQRQSA